MEKISVNFTFDRNAKMAVCRISDVTSSASSSTEHTFVVDYDLNKISIEYIFNDFLHRLEYYENVFKSPKVCK